MFFFVLLDETVVFETVAWFQQAEAQLMLRSITTSEMRYFYVVSMLDVPSLVRVVPFLLNFCTPYNYEELKTSHRHIWTV